MTPCRQLGVDHPSRPQPHPFSVRPGHALSAWRGRKIVVVHEQWSRTRCCPTATEELLQKLLRRSLLNLPNTSL